MHDTWIEPRLRDGWVGFLSSWRKQVDLKQLHGSLNGWGTKFSACCAGLTPGSGQSGSWTMFGE